MLSHPSEGLRAREMWATGDARGFYPPPPPTAPMFDINEANLTAPMFDINEANPTAPNVWH